VRGDTTRLFFSEANLKRVTRGAFDALEKKLGAKADLSEVVVSLTRNVMKSWDAAASKLEEGKVIRDRIKDRIDFFGPRFC
jgi:hypothetical protein